MRQFEKNDKSFICVWCGRFVPELKYSSRDHCTNCLASLHVDINPGDRMNTCGGILFPQDVTVSGKKGYIIQYKCSKCGKLHNNKSAEDDNYSTILKVMNKTYDPMSYKVKDNE